MKQPKLGNLRMDKAGTREIRSRMAKAKKIKITINIDQSSLEALKGISGETGIPYQTLLNKLLKESLEKRQETESRLGRLEVELAKLKKKLVA